MYNCLCWLRSWLETYKPGQVSHLVSRSPFLSKIPYSFHLINISKTRQLLNQISPNQSHLLDLIWQRNVWLCGFCMWRWHESKHHIGDLNCMYLIERLGHVGSFEWFNPMHILSPQLSWAFWFVHRLLSWRYIINICTQTRTWQLTQVCGPASRQCSCIFFVVYIRF